ncbi:MAG: maleylpyruvate isomerase N-terminal domain-containing protein [Actinobacteria bacterium]|nr:maleylpyruvate isomerase N-terminal domain-containing protein [Actinomycetota bacterium]MBV9936138.1 maleylpyruvate isomerase N-terminal domain-containing protein [Actinomycetota bacterium]
MAQAPEIPQAEHMKVELDPAAALAAYTRHRRRFAEEVASLSDEELATPSRCAKWSVADVLRHGVDVDSWMHSIWSGGPLPFTSFDPRTTPHESVVTGRAAPDDVVRDRYAASARVMAEEVAGSDASRWGLPSICPAGPVPWWMSALHVFYDSWVHERDALLPLGRTVPVEAEETAPVWAWAVSLVGHANKAPLDAEVGGVHVMLRDGVVSTRATGAAEGDIAAMIDAVSGRGSVEDALAGCDPAVVHRLGALAQFFHTEP